MLGGVFYPSTLVTILEIVISTEGAQRLSGEIFLKRSLDSARQTVLARDDGILWNSAEKSLILPHAGDDRDDDEDEDDADSDDGKHIYRGVSHPVRNPAILRT